MSEEWVEPLQDLGYNTIDRIKVLEKPRRLHQEMMGYRKWLVTLYLCNLGDRFQFNLSELNF